jgi:hypothetical protein
VGQGSVECNRDCVIFGSVREVCELEWVKDVWDDGVDVSHDQSFKSLCGYRCEWHTCNKTSEGRVQDVISYMLTTPRAVHIYIYNYMLFNHCTHTVCVRQRASA